MKNKIRFLLLTLTLFIFTAVNAFAVPLIRDAEIESLLHDYTNPLLQSADLDQDAVQLFIVNNDALNAFVTGGQNIYVHTGLLRRSDHPGQMMGVLAHEIGHIRGGHLSRAKQQIETVSTLSLLSTILGAAAGAAAGDGRVATAIMSGGNQIASRAFLSFTRDKERSADKTALELLDANSISSKGQLEILIKLKQMESLLGANQNPYTRSHPVNTERINFVKEHLEHSPYTNKEDPADLTIRHQRMLGKLDGFMDKPKDVLKKYSENDTSIRARYARSVALFRLPDVKKGIASVDALIKDYPNDPYFWELKGQMLFENGRINDSIAAYQKAVSFAPREPLIKVGLAQSLLQTGSKANIEAAKKLMDAATKTDPRNSFAWKLLGISYGKLNQPGEAALALAEQASITGDKESRLQQATKASTVLPYGSPGWLRAQDLLLKNDKKDEESEE